jgi:hypothetical protein
MVCAWGVHAWARCASGESWKGIPKPPSPSPHRACAPPTDHGAVLHGAALQQRAGADGDVVTDAHAGRHVALHALGGGDDRAVPHGGEGADGDVVQVAPHHGAIEDRRLVQQGHRADDGRVRGHKHVRRDVGVPAEVAGGGWWCCVVRRTVTQQPTAGRHALVHQVHDGAVPGEGLLEDGLLQRAQACVRGASGRWGVPLGRRAPPACRGGHTRGVAALAGSIRPSARAGGRRERPAAGAGRGRTLAPSSHPWRGERRWDAPHRPVRAPRRERASPILSMACPVSRTARPSSPITRRNALAMAGPADEVFHRATRSRTPPPPPTHRERVSASWRACRRAEARGNALARGTLERPPNSWRSCGRGCTAKGRPAAATCSAVCALRTAVWPRGPPRAPRAHRVRPLRHRRRRCAWVGGGASPSLLVCVLRCAQARRRPHRHHGVRFPPEQGLLRPGEGHRRVQV